MKVYALYYDMDCGGDITCTTLLNLYTTLDAAETALLGTPLENEEDDWMYIKELEVLS